jgi:hypothetical protein
MERGKESTKKHLNALDYKLKVREEELHNIQVEKLQALESQKKILTNSVDFSVYKNLGFERNNLVLKILSECKEKEIFNYPQIFQKINPQLWNEILQLNTKMLEEEKNQLKERNDRKINLERMNERVSSQQTEVKKAETEVKKFTVAAEPLKPAPRKKGPRL